MCSFSGIVLNTLLFFFFPNTCSGFYVYSFSQDFHPSDDMNFNRDIERTLEVVMS